MLSIIIDDSPRHLSQIESTLNSDQTAHCLSIEKIKQVGLFTLGIALHPLNVYFHEHMHAVVIKLLFVNVTPKVVIDNLIIGRCEYGNNSPLELTAIGTFFGMNNARSLAAATGPIADILFIALPIFLTKSQTVATLSLVNAIILSNYAILNPIVSLFNNSENIHGDFARILEKSGVVACVVLSSLSLAASAYTVKMACKKQADKIEKFN